MMSTIAVGMDDDIVRIDVSLEDVFFRCIMVVLIRSFGSGKLEDTGLAEHRVC